MLIVLTSVFGTTCVDSGFTSVFGITCLDSGADLCGNLTFEEPILCFIPTCFASVFRELFTPKLISLVALKAYYYILSRSQC